MALGNNLRTIEDLVLRYMNTIKRDNSKVYRSKERILVQLLTIHIKTIQAYSFHQLYQLASKKVVYEEHHQRGTYQSINHI